MRIARRRAKAKRAYYTHLTTYMVMGAFFLVLNILTDSREMWFYWPMLGWGIGLAIHYFTTFGLPGSQPFNEQWEDRQVERDLPRMRGFRSAEPEEQLELRDLPRRRPVAHPHPPLR